MQFATDRAMNNFSRATIPTTLFHAQVMYFGAVGVLSVSATCAPGAQSVHGCRVGEGRGSTCADQGSWARPRGIHLKLEQRQQGIGGVFSPKWGGILSIRIARVFKAYYSVFNIILEIQHIHGVFMRISIQYNFPPPSALNTVLIPSGAKAN